MILFSHDKYKKIIHNPLIILNHFTISDNMKAYRDAEKEEILETEVNHNFEADMYLEKLEQDEKVSYYTF